VEQSRQRGLVPQNQAPTRAAAGPAPAASPFSLVNLQESLGNQGLLGLLAAGRLQTKLAVNQPGDVYEQEADRVAQEVTSGSAPPAVQRKAAGESGPATAPPAVNEALGSSGQPLDPATRASLEPRFGRSFEDVRVHTGERATEATGSIEARAFTVGRDVVFGAGQYAPGTQTGRTLLAHELTHVVQQRGEPSGVVQRAGWSDAAAPASPNAGRTSVGKMLRIPISGLKEGNQDVSVSSETKEAAADPAKPGETSDPRGRAIVIVPASMTSSPPEKVEVLLHLHGHNVGYRARNTQTSEGGMDKGAMAPNTVRDVTADKIEQQLEASNRPMIGVLPQGTTGSGFGAAGLDSTAFINEALAKVAVELKWPKAPQAGSVVLSAHSGGGGRVAEMLPVGGKALKGSLPAGMKELVLLDAINGPNELSRVKAWVLDQLAQDLSNLTGKSEPDQRAYLKTSLRLRARYTPKYPVEFNEKVHKGQPFVEEGGKKWLTDASGKKVIKGYGVEYEQLEAAINGWFKAKASGLPSAVLAEFRSNYSVTPAGHSFHDAIVGRDDALLKAIKDLP
jgi:hypothetical protein